MRIVKELYYTKDHKWVRIEGDKADIGLTDYGQDLLGEIVFVELPLVGDEFGTGDYIGVVESVKAVVDIYTPVSGKVIKVNEELQDSSEKINEAPYENWMLAIELKDNSELEDLMSAEEYEQFCTEEGIVE